MRRTRRAPLATPVPAPGPPRSPPPRAAPSAARRFRPFAASSATDSRCPPHAPRPVLPPTLYPGAITPRGDGARAVLQERGSVPHVHVKLTRRRVIRERDATRLHRFVTVGGAISRTVARAVDAKFKPRLARARRRPSREAPRIPWRALGTRSWGSPGLASGGVRRHGRDVALGKSKKLKVKYTSSSDAVELSATSLRYARN